MTKLRSIKCIIYAAKVLLISTITTKIVVQKRCYNIFNIDPLTEKIKKNTDRKKINKKNKTKLNKNC